MHLVASRLEGNDVPEIARQVTDEVGRRLSPDNVTFLVDQKLRPLGLLAGATGEPAAASPPSPATPLLGLRFRAALLPAGLVRRAAGLLRPLFLPPVVISVVATVVAVDLWLLLGHGVGEGVRQVLHQPLLVPAVWGIIVLAGVFHELGHATACRYGGGRPGRIGFGLYLVWPVFYSDVTDSYRLGRRGRLRTDLGGLYFNMLFVLASAGAYVLAGWEFALVVIVIQHMAMLQQLLPFVRLDGYYVVSDLVGVPDLFAYVKPIVRSAVFRRPLEPPVANLGPRARRVVTIWVLVTIPLLAASVGLLAVHLPEWSAMTYESATVQLRRLARAIDAGGATAVLGPLLEAAALVLPLVGVTLTLLLSVVRAGRHLSRRVRSARHVLGEERTEEDAAVDATSNEHIAASDARAFGRPVTGSHGPGPMRQHDEGWDAHLDLNARLDRARARIDEEAHELVEALSRTVEAAQQELHLARSLRSKAEEEAEAIRAAATRDAADLLARTRNGVQALLQDLCRQLGPAGDETLGEADPDGPSTLLGRNGLPSVGLR